MSNLTTKALNNELIRLATESPEAVYKSPTGRPIDVFYTRGEAAGEAGCIFGQALKNLGVSPATLSSFDNAKGCPPEISLVAKYLGLGLNPSWCDVQVQHDMGQSWRESVANLRVQNEC